MLPILSNWYMVHLTHSHIFGRVYNDPECYYGQEIQSDPIVEIDVERRLLITTGKTYKLGFPDPIWAAEMTKQLN